ncbi:hypothetical protein [Streptomyces sp. NBC_00658]|uniref:effector-associated constant component EACC1 n=1 Tax=Streptomyces sp. NBC_00658 TaxID=2975800 RepID=UPI0032542BC0
MVIDQDAAQHTTRGVGMTTGAEVAITPRTDRFDAEDERWLSQIADLVTTLREEVGVVSQGRIPEPGTKGASSQLILALSSAGVLTAAVNCFRAWLKRDKARTLTVTWSDDSGTEQTVTVTGDSIDQASFQALAEGIGNRLGG